MTKMEAIKTFFSTPEKPISNAELLRLRKQDPKSYDELGKAALEALQKN